ncbi:endonuclease domain-containing protein [Aetokthonos hydrillicola Thurmond2011]|jgi:hypothetical protein|uniref:Endonuclease domain-containing protein n=1 Tax=Aetokthonos hydrillicola Thurmond2011 TaxID=2712845 RepID=A0AAP5IA98_9CYAN|nr:hypothetical protein [Aetokthonos hydrillicola]MBO3460253.1 hypothetical protein [Aetokthonos hydrillicola CCALA 1050]MBW4586986.1 endonuclease domain-containing protein [Aetokthonos hydrillicola CCALA 1050]MDR9897539.1 endonuclease domain-containing protein [Aetokthonos hydrillicola Thurmond2011]
MKNELYELKKTGAKSRQRHYPIILIPPKIKQIKSAQPLVSPPPIPPRQPGSQPNKLNIILTVLEVAIAVVAIPIISQMTSVSPWLLFVLTISVITGHIFSEITTYPKRKQKHDDEVADYLKNLEHYKQIKDKHDLEVAAAHSSVQVAEYRSKKLLKVLRQTIPHDGNGSTARTNPIEIRFINFVSQYFSGKVYKGLFLVIPGFRYRYTPDITYIDQELNLYIDIEIDEPYVFRTGRPTHFLEASKDNRRNNFFIKRNWSIIRFSEEQVICHPHSCCKTIAYVISEITDNWSLLEPFANIPDLQPQPQWTREQAIQMAQRRERTKYHTQLSFLPITETNTQQEISPNSKRRRKKAQTQRTTINKQNRNTQMKKNSGVGSQKSE